MRRVLPLAVFVLVVSTIGAERVGAWGFNGHKFITDRAIDLLPQEIRPFFVKARTTLVEHAIDPDTYRTIGFLEEPPRHFLDMDAYGPSPFKELPHDYSEAVTKYGKDMVIKNGIVPWRTEEVYIQLREAFRQLPTSPYARDNVKLFSSVIAHYAEDSFQPFHAALNYDGQLTNQNGIHARFETELFDRYQDRLHLSLAPAAQIPSAREFVFNTLTDSYTSVAPILAADLEAINGREAYDDGYFEEMWKRTGPIMEKRMSGAATGVASLIMSAWIEAGRPPLPVDPPARPPRPIRR